MARRTISIAASGDDVQINTDPTASYPPTGTSVNTTITDIWNVKQFTGGFYRTSMTFLRFDTSVIPDGATITSAVLRMRVGGGILDADNRDMNFEWYPWTTLTGADFTETAGTTAGVVDITTGLIPLATGNVENVLSLSNPDANINKTGYTGLRIGISGGQPTGINEVYLRAIDNGTSHEAQLVVTYASGPTFPHTSVLDDFNRANGAPGANWATPIIATYGSYNIVSNQLNTATTFLSNYWAAQFKADQEVFAKLVALPAGGFVARLYCRIQNPNTAVFNAYSLMIDDAGSGLYLLSNVAGAGTFIQNLGTTVAAGDVLGLRAIGSTISCFKNGSQVGVDQIDTSVTGAGYIGLDHSSTTTVVWDDFGGGSLGPLPPINWVAGVGA